MRYLPLTPEDRQAMLAKIGAQSVDDLFVDVPEEARLTGPIEGQPGCCGRRTSSARCSRCLLGTQPTFTQVPPMGSPSLMMTADLPRSFAFVAAANPAAPPPMITRSYSGMGSSVDRYDGQTLDPGFTPRSRSSREILRAVGGDHEYPGGKPADRAQS